MGCQAANPALFGALIEMKDGMLAGVGGVFRANVAEAFLCEPIAYAEFWVSGHLGAPLGEVW